MRKAQHTAAWLVDSFNPSLRRSGGPRRPSSGPHDFHRVVGPKEAAKGVGAPSARSLDRKSRPALIARRPSCVCSGLFRLSFWLAHPRAPYRRVAKLCGPLEPIVVKRRGFRSHRLLAKRKQARPDVLTSPAEGHDGPPCAARGCERPGKLHIHSEDFP